MGSNGHADGLKEAIMHTLENGKAKDVIDIDLTNGKSSIADHMIVASGLSSKHIRALSEHIVKSLRNLNHDFIHIEGKNDCNWIVVDAGMIVVHLFCPEVREFYNLERMWQPENITRHH